MSKLLLLVQNDADVQHLDASARAILKLSITGVWVVFSPAITVNASEAAAKLDSEIEQLRVAERQAADRGDYTAAAGYKTQREGKELDRAKALRDAWKTAPAEERQAKTKDIFGPFIAQLKPNGLSVRITSHSDHYDREQWVAMLNSLSGVWMKEFVPGSFVVAWPEAVSAAIAVREVFNQVGAPQIRASIPAEAKKQFEKDVAARQAPTAPQTRQEALQGMRTFALYAEAKKVGVDPKGKEKAVIVAEILDRESKPVTAPEPVEVY